VPHFGPPMAPSMTASAFLAAVRASSVSGDPVASIEAWEELSVGGRGVIAWTLRQHTYAAEQVFLEVEFDIWSLLFEDS